MHLPKHQLTRQTSPPSHWPAQKTDRRILQRRLPPSIAESFPRWRKKKKDSALQSLFPNNPNLDLHRHILTFPQCLAIAPPVVPPPPRGLPPVPRPRRLPRSLTSSAPRRPWLTLPNSTPPMPRLPRLAPLYPKDPASSVRWPAQLRTSLLFYPGHSARSPRTSSLRSYTDLETNSGVAVGSSIGHAIGGMFGGGSSSEPAAPQQTAPPAQQQANYSQNDYAGNCQGATLSFNQCMDEHQGNMSVCNWYLEQLKACQQAARQY